MKRNKKGFTLIELIAVLVILAILALIVTPLVLNIIKKARISADKRSIDAYGKSIELSIATYLLDNGDIPTSIEQLTIEYTGDKVDCATTNINSDASVYLANCTVNNRVVEGYTYGKDNTPTYEVYNVGDEITYNNVDYYVIKDSSAKESTVTLLKAEPLSVAEVNEYGAGHINKQTSFSVGTASDLNGYGSMAYYSSETCGCIGTGDNGLILVNTNCINSYDQSDIKYVVDAWAQAKASNASEARLTTFDELSVLGYELRPINDTSSTMIYKITENTPSWVYQYDYWTMSQDQDSMEKVWATDFDKFHTINVDNGKLVRPVIVLSKSEL